MNEVLGHDLAQWNSSHPLGEHLFLSGAEFHSRPHVALFSLFLKEEESDLGLNLKTQGPRLGSLLLGLPQAWFPSWSLSPLEALGVASDAEHCEQGAPLPQQSMTHRRLAWKPGLGSRCLRQASAGGALGLLGMHRRGHHLAFSTVSRTAHLLQSRLGLISFLLLLAPGGHALVLLGHKSMVLGAEESKEGRAIHCALLLVCGGPLAGALGRYRRLLACLSIGWTLIFLLALSF